MKYSLLSSSFFFFFAFLFLFPSCGVYRAKELPKESFDELENSILVQKPNPQFPLPAIPKSIEDPQKKAIYLANHYWEEFPFENTSLINSQSITEQGFVDYIHVLNYIPFKDARKSIKYLFAQARSNREMYSYFASLFEKYYYNADSPFRNEELYIPVLETVLKNNLLSHEDYEKYGFQKEMIHKNRVGSKANNFTYYLNNGERKTMYAIKSNYLILFFYSPDSDKSVSIAHDIQHSDVLKKVCSLNSFSRTMLYVLGIYPESNLPMWYESLSYMPQKNWELGYDKSMKLINRRVYNLKTLPTIYLLDKNKQIILKETTLEEIESYFLSKQ